MEENKNTGQLVLAFNKELITPAKISPKLLDWELLEQTTLEIEEYKNIIFNDDFDLESTSLLRKNISNSKTQLDNFRKELKSYLESETKVYNDNLSSYVNRLETVRKYLHDLEKLADQKRIDLKWEKNRELKKVLVKSLVNKDLEQFIDDYDKWETKGCKMNTIEADIQEQINRLNSKYNSIALILKGINEKIETKIQIDDIINMFDQDQDYIVKYITEKEKQITDAEETMRKKAEEGTQKAIQAEKEKAEIEKNKAVEQAKKEERKKITKSYDTTYKTKSVEITNDNYVTLQVKIPKHDAKTAKLLKWLFKRKNIEYIKL